VYFVQIGAADGRRFDPIHPFVARYGWKGILVEPLSDIFELLRGNYGNRDGLVFENVAITEQDEIRTISRVPLEKVGGDGVPGWAFGASTLVPEKTRFAPENSPAHLHAALTSALVTEQVRCLSLASLLSKHSVERIDVLQLDTEGYDARILRQLDLSRYRPAIINMEWQWLDEAEKAEVSTRLRDSGYSLYTCEADLLATSSPLVDFMVAPPAPDPESVPRFFPGVNRFTSETRVSGLEGSAASYPERIEFRRLRNSRVAIPGSPGLLTFISLIDGSRSYGEIAALMGCPVEMLTEWGTRLQSVFLLD
jgi:FkbM family methyltransferase